MSYFVLVKDIRNNTEFVFNAVPVDAQEASNMFDDVFEHVKLTNPNSCTLSLTKQESYCEIINTFENNVSGWLWNSNKSSPQIVYTLRRIPCFISAIETQSVSTQTNRVHIRHGRG
jgi:hypothetical protein